MKNGEFVYKNINLLCWCKHFNQGSIRIVKNKYTDELYCECDEDYELWASPEDYEKGISIVKNRLYLKHHFKEDFFVLASEEEIIKKGWHNPINKVEICGKCVFRCNPLGWIVIKKNKNTGQLFCRCELCGSIWRDIKDVLRTDISSINIKIDNYEDATRDEIIAVGWDKYIH